MNIFQLIQRNNKSLVVVVNKWDLVENKDQAVIKTFENAIRQRMAPFVDFPIVFASALTKQRIFKVLEMAKEVYQNRKAKVGTIGKMMMLFMGYALLSTLWSPTSFSTFSGDAPG